MTKNNHPTEIHAKDLESYNGCDEKLAESESSAGAVRCVCGRTFRPVGPQRYCSHDCYSGTLRVPIEQRFWTKVNKTATCWLWTAATIRGYGQIAGIVSGKPRPVYAHRVSWELSKGAIPVGLEVLHHCDVPLCVRPDHLFLGTQQQNLTDAREKGRLDETRPRRGVLTLDERFAIFYAKSYRGLQADLSRRYGVSKACISAIRLGRFARPDVSLHNVVPLAPEAFQMPCELVRLSRQCDQSSQSVHTRQSAKLHTSSVR